MMTRPDIILIFALAALVVFLVPLTHVTVSQKLNGAVTLTSPYGNTVINDSGNVSRPIYVQGSEGVVVFEATKEGIEVVRSSCQDQLCVEAGILSSVNPIVCAPNGVGSFLVDNDGGFDAVSR